MNNSKLISIVVPCYNEEDNTEHFYQEIKKVFEPLEYDFEIIFIDDGSKDNTVQSIISLNSIDPRVKLIALTRNFGKEIALTSGLDAASGAAAIPMDVDLQDPPELVPELIKKWEEGYDVVYAVRTQRKGEGFMKRFTAYSFYKIINKITKIEIPRNTGDYRILDQKVLKALKGVREYHRFMKGLFSWVGYKQIGIEYIRQPRYSGRSKFNYMKLIGFAIEGLTSFTVAPLRLATIFGFLISLVAFFYGLYIILTTVLRGADVPGYPSLFVAILFLGGIQLITIGLIGEYIGRIFNETKNRPLYLVREQVGFDNNATSLN
jgi:polyisoprenyl-phosphate glycosyltransferase